MAAWQSLIPFALAWGVNRVIGFFVELPVWAVVIVSLGVVIGYTAFFGNGRSIVGQKAALLQGLKYVQGNPVTLGEGQVSVVEFWATWCPPCRTSIPHLNKLYNQYKSKDVQFVGVTSEKEDVVKGFIQKMGADFAYPVALDPAQAVTSSFPVAGIPVAFVISRDGKVVWQGHPMKDLAVGIEKALASS